MQWLEDSKILLSVSSLKLKEIEKVYNESLSKDSLPSTFKVTIKNFLENIRSSLDYPSQYIFNTYCSTNYTEKELKRKNTYFPIRKNKDFFIKCISKDFRGLPDTRSDIYQIFENCQAFNGQMWTQYLSDLSNKNKHINLSRHQRSESANINYMEDIFGNKLINCSIVNCQHAVSYNGITNINNNPYIKTFYGSFDVEYRFEEINQPVLSVLNDIYNGAALVIEQLEKIL